MLDLLLGKDGDLAVTDAGDIVLTGSVAQAIKIRLRWFLGEWKYGPDFGVPYYEEILIKNPGKLRTEQLIKEQIMNVAEVTDVPELSVSVDVPARVMTVRYTAQTSREAIREEVELHV